MSFIAGGRAALASIDAAAGGSVRPQSTPPEKPGGERWRLPAPSKPTLCEVFSNHPRDAGWAGFIAAQLGNGPILWVQERMAIIEAGRVHAPGLPGLDLVHVSARDAKSALWAMEEGLRCDALGAVIGELWAEPSALDFTATRRLAFAAEKSGVPCWLVRVGAGGANLSGARFRWRLESAPSLANPLDAKAPGKPAWNVDLFRARGHPPGQWKIVHEPDAASPRSPFRLDLAAPTVGGALAKAGRRIASG
ncbi:MAG: hypothetical protein HKO13_07135 [Sphingomonas sp.]|nr:hypothetical protein [Sphingomonas sp.]